MSLSALHRFQDITTFTAYVTACDLEKFFSFNKTMEITGHVRCEIHVKHVVVCAIIPEV